MSTMKTVTTFAVWGAIIAWLYGKVVGNLAAILIGLALITGTAFIIQPFVNDDINTSEMRGIISRTTQFERISTQVVTFTNSTRFFLEDATLTCGSDRKKLPVIRPAEVIPVETEANVKVCAISYTPRDLNKRRKQNVIYSDGMTGGE